MVKPLKDPKGRKSKRVMLDALEEEPYFYSATFLQAMQEATDIAGMRITGSLSLHPGVSGVVGTIPTNKNSTSNQNNVDEFKTLEPGDEIWIGGDRAIVKQNYYKCPVPSSVLSNMLLIKFVDPSIRGWTATWGYTRFVDDALHRGDVYHTENGLFFVDDAGSCSITAHRRNGIAQKPVIAKSPEDLQREREETRKAINAKLEAVILPENIKRDIISQVVMHNEKDRIFEDWGLGAVIEYGRATTMLFHGGPGTGKTYMARKIAEALGVKMISVMFGEIQSPMPGEYESNLDAKFKEATKENAVLFFDECDGIVQSRTGMGQIMSAENNFLLQQLEKYEGILIMATNRVNSLDEALERRLSLIIEFPNPDEDARFHIWKNHLPEKLPLSEDVDIAVLAKFELTGGQIKNVVLNAARQAVASDKPRVEPEDFHSAIVRVLEGKKAFAEPRETGRRQIGKTLEKI